MKRFFDKFLLGILWLLAITLAITFWMNVQYGFDMLSAAHWEYLGTLQAHRSQIKPDFYISMIAALFIAIIGMYFIVRPKPRNIHIATQQTPPLPTPTIPSPTIAPTPQPNSQPQKPNVAPAYTPRPAPPISVSARPMPPSGLHAMAPKPTITPTVTPQHIPILPPTPAAPQAQEKMDPEIQNVLESAGYITKTCDKIGKVQKTLVAMAYNQTVWIVATNTAPQQMVDAIQTLVTIFDDTLGSTANDIALHGLIINASEPNTRDDDLIITFDNKADFAKYVNEHKNEEPDDYDAELFEAFSTYINTVIGYIGKV